MFEQYVTIACVSNEVGGNLVGNAKWTGVRLRDVLEMAGVQTSATQLVGRSVDGWTAGMPMAWVMDPAREPMIAVKMNDAAAAAGPRLPGPADRARAVRLRLGDEVAARARADDARGVQRLLGPARLVEGGADPDPVADRHAARRSQRRARSRSPGSPGLPTAASRKVEVGIDGTVARGAPVAADLGRHLGPVGPRLGRDARATTPSRSARPMAPAWSRTETAVAARPRWRPRLAHRSRQRRLTALRGQAVRRNRYRVGHATTSLSLRPARTVRGRHGRPAGRPDVLPPGPRRRPRGERRPREGPGRGPRRSPRRAPRRARAARASRPAADRPGRVDAGDDTAPLDEPINEAFRAGSLTLGWDGDAERVLLEARAQAEDGERSIPTRTTTRTRTAPTCCASA